MTEQMWVVAFDKNTNERKDFVCCPKNNTKFYEEKFIMDGYDTKVMTNDELDKMIEDGK